MYLLTEWEEQMEKKVLAQGYCMDQVQQGQ